jgi:hypothetical protein
MVRRAQLALEQRGLQELAVLTAPQVQPAWELRAQRAHPVALARREQPVLVRRERRESVDLPALQGQRVRAQQEQPALELWAQQERLGLPAVWAQQERPVLE